MSLNNIDWRAEALEFAKKHDTRTQMVVQLVELAMKRGAEIAVADFEEAIRRVNVDLKKKRDASAPHREITRPIQLD